MGRQLAPQRIVYIQHLHFARPVGKQSRLGGTIGRLAAVKVKMIPPHPGQHHGMEVQSINATECYGM